MREHFFPTLDSFVMNAFPSLISASTYSDPNPVAVLVNYGALGIIVLLYVTGQIPSKGEVKILREQNAEYRAIISAFQNQAIQTVPALSRSVQVLEAIPGKEAGYLEEAKATQQRMADLVSRLEGQVSRGQEKSP